MWEVVLSEFNISHTDFWFKFTLPQLNLLVQARIIRNERMEKDIKAPEQHLSTVDDMDEFLASFQFGN